MHAEPITVGFVRPRARQHVPCMDEVSLTLVPRSHSVTGNVSMTVGDLCTRLGKPSLLRELTKHKAQASDRLISYFCTMQLTQRL